MKIADGSSTFQVQFQNEPPANPVSQGGGLGGAGLDGLDSAGWLPRQDSSATTALNTLRTNETIEGALGGSFGRKSVLTGDELLGATLEAVMDPGNEGIELQQVHDFVQQNRASLNPSGQRVADVVDKYMAIAKSQGGTLSQEQKAALAGEMVDAAKFRISDVFPSLGASNPFEGAGQTPPSNGLPVGPAGGNALPIGLLPDINPFNDQSATTALNTLNKSEAVQSVVATIQGKTNKLTGKELMGAVLEGTFDPGGESKELRQFQAFARQNAGNLDPAARRVAAVVDKYLALADARGGSLSQADKAAMAKELAQASQPRFLDLVQQPVFGGILPQVLRG